jgi:hypothetical protein
MASRTASIRRCNASSNPSRLSHLIIRIGMTKSMTQSENKTPGKHPKKKKKNRKTHPKEEWWAGKRKEHSVRRVCWVVGRGAKAAVWVVTIDSMDESSGALSASSRQFETVGGKNARPIGGRRNCRPIGDRRGPHGRHSGESQNAQFGRWT